MRYEFEPFSSQFCVDDVPTLSQNFKTLRERFHKWIVHLKVSFTFEFSPFYQHFYMKYQFRPYWRIFGLTMSPWGVKLQSFETVVSTVNTSPQISIYCLRSSFYHHWYMKYKFWTFLTQFWVNDITKGVKTTIFLRK